MNEWKKLQCIFERAHFYAQACKLHPWLQKDNAVCSTMLLWCTRIDLVQAATTKFSSAECYKIIKDELSRIHRDLNPAWNFIQAGLSFGTVPFSTANDPNVDFKALYTDLRAHLDELSTAEAKCHLPIMSKIEEILADVLTNVSVCEGHADAHHAFECYMDLRFHVMDGIEIVEHQIKGLMCPAHSVADHLLNKFRRCESLHAIEFVTALKQMAGYVFNRIPVAVTDTAPISLSRLDTLPSLIVPTGATADYGAFYVELKGTVDDFKADSCTRHLVTQATKIMLEYQKQEKTCKVTACKLENVFVYEIRDLLLGVVKHARNKCVDDDAKAFEKVRRLIDAFIHHKIDVLIAGLKRFPDIFF